MSRRISIISLLSALAVFSSCIRNDIPYPLVVPHILTMDVDGGTVTIDQNKLTVLIKLEETVDLKKVNIKSFSLDRTDIRGAEDLKGRHDLTKPMQVKLSVYEDFVWTIRAERPVERYFTVEKQVGSATIDEVNHRVIVEVSKKKADLSAIRVLTCKLGPKQVSNYSIDFDNPVNFADENGDAVPRELEVSYFGETEVWRLFVTKSDKSLTLTNVNVWTREVYLTAVGIEGEDNGFKYRQKDSGDDWTVVDKSCISTNGGEFTAHLTELEPSTTYEFFPYSGDEFLEASEFTTDAARQFPNPSFDVVSKVTGADYYKWFDPMSPQEDCREKWWACGSGEGPDGVTGTASLGVVLTYPDDEDKMDGERSVRCESKNFAGLLACGNFFTGSFAKVIGTTGGSVNYGRPWDTRPKALRIWVKYNCGKVDLIKGVPVGDDVKLGDNDRSEIAISLGNWDYRVMGGIPSSPVYVNTTAGIYYTENSPGIIAFSHVVMNESTNGWELLEIPLEYRSLTEKPTHIIITCAASYLGDYLTGSSQSKLWVDKAELIY
ncbi:MAG: PCMD domain-containing protein [Rikenellaceae bacterium]|nr:PCMD domain-containing protein [Rikenellaceae bacterium]